MPTPGSVTVPVKSAAASKINWVQVVTACATFATALTAATNMPGAQAAELTAGIAGVGQLLTIILRTFFTASVTPSSLPKG